MANTMSKLVRVGTAGWAIPRRVAECFPRGESSLTRYAAQFPSAEINSTFRRSHKPQTFARWAAAVPNNFRFAVKLPKMISHELRLIGAAEVLGDFVDQIASLGAKLGPLLLQLPPSLSYEPKVARAFFDLLRTTIGQHPVVFEPRHPSWFDENADCLLSAYAIARVAADPAGVPAASRPGGAPGLSYYRLHGAPRTYYSSYDSAFLSSLLTAIHADPAEEVWCIFDNTASGAATANALWIQTQLATTAEKARLRRASP
jgi:uncharacterized protein YecE (DUF72 family)